MGAAPEGGEQPWDVARIVEEAHRAGELDSGDPEVGSRLRLDEIQREAEREVEHHEAAERIAGTQACGREPRTRSKCPPGDQRQRENLVELRGMPAHAV